jgi:hypothetical protein
VARGEVKNFILGWNNSRKSEANGLPFVVLFGQNTVLLDMKYRFHSIYSPQFFLIALK